ncbi:MAG: hypothetical protein ACXWC6_00095 [Ramlibacter sp.]
MQPAQAIEDSEYRELESAFRPHGGVAGCEAVTELLRGRMDQPISRLARWIVGREVLSLEWGSRLMVPLFQFDRFTMLPRPVVGEVLRELAPVLGDWSLALWFARPNALLGYRAPVEAIQGHARAVADAARAQRFLVCG